MDWIDVVQDKDQWRARIDVVQDKDQWRALLNTVMNFRVP
jgi:hypothetical protein